MKPGRQALTRQAWFWPLVIVLATGLLLRVFNLLDVSHSPFFTRPVIDGQVYDEWAMAIRGGTAPAEPFYQDPLYPYFLAFVYSVFGHSYWAVYLIQLLLAVGLLLLIFDTTRLLFEWRAGVVAAALGALYEPFIFYESQIEKTALAVFLIGLFLWTLVRALKSTRRVWPILAGLTLGLATLTRANLLIFAPLLPVVLWLAGRHGRTRTSTDPAHGRPHPIPQSAFRIPQWLLALLALLAVIAPVSLRNSLRAGEFVLTTTQGGQNLYLGNCEYNQSGQYEAPPFIRPNPVFEQADFREYAQKAAGRKLTYGATSQFYTKEAIRWATTRVGDFLRLLRNKTILYFNNFEVPDNQDLYFFARYSWILRLPLLAFGLVFALGLAGMILLTGRALPRLLFVIFFFGYALSVIAFFVFSRYRLPALPSLLPFAGAVLIALWDALRKSVRNPPFRIPQSAIRILLLALAGFALTAFPIRHNPKAAAAQCLVNLASSYYHEGDTTNAIANYQDALREQPGHGEALRNLGRLLFERRDYTQSFTYLSKAAQAEPSNPVAHEFLGEVLQALGRMSSAGAEFRRAVALAPGRVEYRFDLATVLVGLDSIPEALAQYDAMLQLAPDNPLVRHNHAVALYRAGRLPEAMAELETTRRLGGQVNPQFEQLLRTALGR